MRTIRSPRLLAAAACLLFLLTGLPFVPLLGIQNDEALFAAALLPPRGEIYTLHVGTHALPLMLMSYVGTLKSLLYRPLMRWFGTGVWATRVPMLLAGAASIWLFYGLMRRVAGERAALVATGLLASDCLYLLSACFDWGPVALQHLLLVAGVLLLVRFWQERREWMLAAGFFLFGLAMWDKALAVWSLSALGVATLVVFPRQLFSTFSARRLGVAVLAFSVGALPLIWYNIDTNGATYRGTVAYETNNFSHKLLILRITANGSAGFGFFTNDDAQTPRPHAPRTVLELESNAVSRLLGDPRSTWMLYGFFLALILLPWAGRPERRAVLFCLIAMAVAWLQMAVAVNGGGSVHHAILLWPVPQAIMGISLAAASRRLGKASVPALAGLLIVLMGSSLAVTDEYYTVLARNGGALNWSDAIFPLSNSLKDVRASIFAMDWDILDNLRLLDRGRLNLFVGTDPVSKTDWSPEDREAVKQMVASPDHVFVDHVEGREFFTGQNAHLVEWAESHGYRQKKLSTIDDSCGRPTFEVYQFEPAGVDARR